VLSTRKAPRSSTVHVRAIVASALALGLVLAIAASASAAPSVTIDSGPSGPTRDTLPLFAFTVDLTATTIECSIDQGTTAYVPCTATYAPITPLLDGDYAFRVRATDGIDETVVTQDFTVDTTRPSLSIDSGPSGPTNNKTPSFGFATDAPGVECSVDDGAPAYGSCSSTTSDTSAALLDGSYIFHVRATDLAGNQTEASRPFTVDTTPPSLSIRFGPSGTTADNTPLFGFAAEAGATVECSIDHGTPAYGPCASATTYAAVEPLADGSYVFHVRATDAAGNTATATRAFTVNTGTYAPAPPNPRANPTPPATPSKPLLLSPFPLVRISGTLTATGVRIRVLSVRAPRGSLVRVTVRPACGRTRHPSRRCHEIHAAGTVGRRDVIAFRRLARAYRSGTVIVVRVWRADRIGKYTRFTIVRGKAPRRVDQCLMPGATRGSRCPRD
jgi:hypothetical protein